MSSKPAPDAGRPWSVAARLTAWYAAAAFALVVAATGYLYLGLADTLDREDDQFLEEKVREVRRVLEERPVDTDALRRETTTGGAGSDRESGRLLVRVIRDVAVGVIETPGMAGVLPPHVFPADGSADGRGTDGRPFRLRTHRGDGYTVHIGMDRGGDRELLEEFRHRLAYVLGLSLLLAAGGGYWIARRGLRPIADVAATARRIRPTHLTERIVVAGLPAEVRDLADTFNTMLDRLEDAFARLGRFAADIAHELRTPLNALRTEADVALGRPRTADEYRAALGSCLDECDRLARLIDSLLFLARAENPKRELAAVPVDVGAELRVVQEFYDPVAADAGVTLAVNSVAGVTIRGDRTLIQQAIGNLVANAVAHTPTGGTVMLFAAAGPDGVRFGVRDTGPGIPAEHLPYLFDRFYRADPVRSAGSGRVGLGLAIVKAVADLHGGSVGVTSSPGAGAAFTVFVPEPSPRPTSSESAPASAGR